MVAGISCDRWGVGMRLCNTLCQQVSSQSRTPKYKCVEWWGRLTGARSLLKSRCVIWYSDRQERKQKKKKQYTWKFHCANTKWMCRGAIEQHKIGFRMIFIWSCFLFWIRWKWREMHTYCVFVWWSLRCRQWRNEGGVLGLSLWCNFFILYSKDTSTQF